MSGAGEGLFPVVPARPMDSAPRDGRILRLLVYYAEEGSENPLEDAHQAWTIGSNGFDNDGVDEWALAGWSWTHDCFTSGRGKVLGWLPFHGEDAPVTDEPAPPGERVYFITGDDEEHGPLTVDRLHQAIGYIWDAAAGDGWIEGIDGLAVYEGRVISRAVEKNRRRGVDCPVCCGGNVAEEIAEANGGEDCPACDGVGRVDEDDQGQPWTSQFDEIVDYEMVPPLPLNAPGG